MFSNKGQLTIDAILVVIVLIVVGIVAVFLNNIFGQINDDIQANPSFDNASKELLNNSATGYSSLFDGIIVFAFGLFWLFLIISSFFLDSSPVFFVVMVILSIAVLIVIAIVGNTFESIITDANIADSANEFPMTVWLFSHLLEIMIGMIFTTMIALYAKRGNSI